MLLSKYTDECIIYHLLFASGKEKQKYVEFSCIESNFRLTMEEVESKKTSEQSSEY